MSTLQTTAAAQGARDGQAYLDSLRDGREVWVQGERVQDVTRHPLFRGVARTVATLYDLQATPGTREVMTYALPDGSGRRASCSYLPPRSPDELAMRRANTEVWARESFGLLGRPPDFCASILVGLNAVRDLLAEVRPEFGDNAAEYLEFARDNDLCLAHALHDPPMDKSLRPEQDPDRCLHIVDERPDGIVVRGARTMSTFAPLSNEILVYPAYPLNERERDFSLFFAVAVATPGVKLLCREPFTRDRDPFDHPAAARFDEQDAMVIFDDVFVPWQRVFVAQAPAITSQLLRGQAMAWAGFSADLVLLEKMELLIGVCHLLAQAGGIDTQPFVVEELGELITYKEMMRSAVRVEQLEGHYTPAGYFSPRRAPFLRSFVTSTAERLASLIEHVGTSSLVMTPSAADMEVPELRPFIDRYLRGKNISAAERIKLSKLAWDLSCDAFGGRQTLYERLHSGDPHGLMALAYRTYDVRYAVSQVQRLLSSRSDGRTLG